MNFLPTFEVPLQSYISHLEKTFEEGIQNGENIDISALEKEFDRESDHFIIGITKRIHQIRDQIKSHRPTNANSPDYQTQMIYYRQFLQTSSIGINQMTDWINFIFDQITSIVKNIVQWLSANTETIVYILEQIRNAFKLLATFFKTI